jgi:sugar fermentation stimulation protein A
VSTHIPLTLEKITFLRRYKRFLADVRTADGKEQTVHCPNTGSMRDLCTPGVIGYVSYTENPKRKYAGTLEALYHGKTLVGINTQRPNHIVSEGLKAGLFDTLGAYKSVQREALWCDGTRFDFLLKTADEKRCYVEVKNVHYRVGDHALFPDSPTARGLKHLDHLLDVTKAGHRAVLLYIIQRDDCTAFDFCDEYDSAYAKRAREVYQAGVEMSAYALQWEPGGIHIMRAPVPYAPRPQSFGMEL